MRTLRPVLLTLLAGLAVAGCTSPRRVAAVRPFEPDSVPEAFRYSSAALMWPGATRAMQVTPAGDLYNGAWVTRFDASVDGAKAPPPRVIAFEDRWMPVAHWTRRRGDVRFDFEAVALPAPTPFFVRLARPIADYANARIDDEVRQQQFAAASTYSASRIDSMIVRAAHKSEPSLDERVEMFVSLEVRATNLGARPHRAAIDSRFEDGDSTQAFQGFDALGIHTGRYRWAPAGAADSVLGVSDGFVRGRESRSAWVLGPGASKSARFVIAAYPTGAAALERWAKTPHASRADQARAAWRAAVGRGMQVELGDPDLEHALDAARVTLLALRERRDGRWVPLGGPFHYRDVWLRDGARALTALALYGYTREAREMTASFRDWQWVNGPFVSQAAQLDGTGQALWTFEQTMLRPVPDPDIARYADAAYRAVAWCERRRAAGAASGGPFATLLPYADPHDNELARAQLVGTDAWAIAGYRAAERLLRAAGRARAADSVAAARQSYVADFVAALAHTHSADIPPSWQDIGLDWGNLTVGWPCAVLPPGHPRLEALARRYWTAAGGPGLGYYGSKSLLHGYVGADLGTWALLAGHRSAADGVLVALERWRSASGGAGEMFTRDGDYGLNLPPHATSAAALLTLVRNCLIYDDGDTLALTLGARSSWWSGAHLSRAPTRWGLLDLEFHRAGDVAEWRWSPVPTWTVLALPPGTLLASPPLAPLRAAGPGRILAPPGASGASVRVIAGDGALARK